MFEILNPDVGEDLWQVMMNCAQQRVWLKSNSGDKFFRKSIKPVVGYELPLNPLRNFKVVMFDSDTPQIQAF